MKIQSDLGLQFQITAVFKQTPLTQRNDETFKKITGKLQVVGGKCV